jgi:hypothetical protein
MKSTIICPSFFPIRFLTFLLPFCVFPLAICVAQSAMPQSAGQQTKADDTRATFKRLNDHLRSSEFQFQTSYDSRNTSLGASRGSAKFFVARPNLLRVELSGNGFSYLIVSDGKLFTIYDEKKRKYAQLPAPEKPIQAVNLFTGLAVFEAQVLRFLGTVGDVANGDPSVRIYEGGSELIHDTQCSRYSIGYASDRDSDKWDVWLKTNGVPLPCKTVVSNQDKGNEQTNLYDWTNGGSNPDAFTFNPPAGSTKVGAGDLDMRPPY